MKEPDNYTELLQAVRLIAEHCEVSPCKDCPFVNGLGECVLHIEIPFNWMLWLPEEKRCEDDRSD